MDMNPLKRPKMSGLLHAQIKRNLIIAITLSIIAGGLHRFLVVYPRRQRYADFYK